MALKYETGIATLIQFVAISLLSFADDTVAIVTACRHGNQCVSNAFVTIILMLLTAFWFLFIWVLGFTAQTQRKRRLIQILVIAEALTILVALFNIKHHNDTLGLVTSCIDISLGLWVIFLARRILKAKGGRIVVANRARRRPIKRDGS